MAGEHPYYGTCTGCTQGKIVLKTGLIKPHKRTVARGNTQLTVECAGSMRSYAEANRMDWNASLSQWMEMSIEVSATLHTTDGELHLLPVEVHPFSEVKAGLAVVATRELSFHIFHITGKGMFATYRVELQDSDGEVVDMRDDVRGDGHLNGTVLNCLERLADETESSDA